MPNDKWPCRHDCCGKELRSKQARWKHETKLPHLPGNPMHDASKCKCCESKKAYLHKKRVHHKGKQNTLLRSVPNNSRSKDAPLPLPSCRLPAGVEQSDKAQFNSEK